MHHFNQIQLIYLLIHLFILSSQLFMSLLTLLSNVCVKCLKNRERKKKEKLIWLMKVVIYLFLHLEPG